MEGITNAIVLWSARAGQAALRAFTTERVIYRDASVKTQFVRNMHPVSATIRPEYRIVTVKAWALTSAVVGPSRVLYVARFMTSVVLGYEVKPLGSSTPENRATSTELFVLEFMA